MSAESQNCETSRQPLLRNGSANTPVARQWLSERHVTAAALAYATIEELLEAVFSVQSAPRLHIERTVAKAWRTYLRTYSLFKCERLSTNIKITLCKALIRSVMTYACPTWEYAADAHLLKLERLQNRVLRATGNLDRRTMVCEMHVAFKIPYACNYITKLCRTQAEVILDHRNPIVRDIGQGEAIHRKNKRLDHFLYLSCTL
jgi:hypothetical protein